MTKYLQLIAREIEIALLIGLVTAGFVSFAIVVGTRLWKH